MVLTLYQKGHIEVITNQEILEKVLDLAWIILTITMPKEDLMRHTLKTVNGPRVQMKRQSLILSKI